MIFFFGNISFDFIVVVKLLPSVSILLDFLQVDEFIIALSLWRDSNETITSEYGHNIPIPIKLISPPAYIF